MTTKRRRSYFRKDLTRTRKSRPTKVFKTGQLLWTIAQLTVGADYVWVNVPCVYVGPAERGKVEVKLLGDGSRVYINKQDLKVHNNEYGMDLR